MLCSATGAIVANVFNRTALISGVLALAFAPAAQASLAPTPKQLAHAEHVARAYWHGTPPCGQPKITLATMTPNTAQPILALCEIQLSNNPEDDWRDEPEALCIAVTHEWGHLVLGLRHYAASNPTEPSDSPDPHSIMYRAGPQFGFAACSEITWVAHRHRR